MCDGQEVDCMSPQSMVTNDFIAARGDEFNKKLNNAMSGVASLQARVLHATLVQFFASPVRGFHFRLGPLSSS